jgi:hypothetical protein
MSATFAVPFYGRCISPQPEPRPARFKVGARVVFLEDRDEGYVTGLIPGQAVAIRWENAGRIEVYSMFSGAMERIAVLATDRGGDWLS